MASADKIRLLSESLCKLVRAQEVVTQPASAVKELLDNAIDAGATKISLDIKAGGKEYIHVTDNGCGMSIADARMAFEIHATSKLRSIEDLEKLVTLGFRGEGLASIAEVSNVVLKTRREEDELGTEVIMAGGAFQEQRPVVTPVGTSIRVSDVFYNVKGRRGSLKSDKTEESAIDKEFTQCVLAHPDINFAYYKGGKLFREMSKGSLKERIIAVAGRRFHEKLIPINYESPIVNISGFITSPDEAVQRSVQQYLFVNGRYIKHDYLRSAIELAYDGLLQPKERPHFFVYLSVPTENVDINIHPSKKEVRFTDEAHIWQLLKQMTREALSANALIPTIDWDNPNTLEIPAYQGRRDAFETPSLGTSEPRSTMARRVFFSGSSGVASGRSSGTHFGGTAISSDSIDWNSLAEDYQRTPQEEQGQIFATPVLNDNPDMGLPMAHGVFQGTDYPTTGLLIYKGKYIVSSLRRSLALIDFHRAHLRVLYERYRSELAEHGLEVQAQMFPPQLDFSLVDHVALDKLLELLPSFGFKLEAQGEGSYLITQCPAPIAEHCADFVMQMIQAYKDAEDITSETLREYLALEVAKLRCYSYGSKLEPQQVDDLLSKLFLSSNTNIDPYGRPIISLISEDEIERRF
ncbi:MAG: DNA mismatch repair endonuclease MutL [Porphyromonas sp.]|nr:DNA mismatch repair endonuclease MutL [Porphyromonas sp.]